MSTRDSVIRAATENNLEKTKNIEQKSRDLIVDIIRPHIGDIFAKEIWWEEKSAEDKNLFLNDVLEELLKSSKAAEEIFDKILESQRQGKFYNITRENIDLLCKEVDFLFDKEKNPVYESDQEPESEPPQKHEEPESSINEKLLSCEILFGDIDTKKAVDAVKNFKNAFTKKLDDVEACGKYEKFEKNDIINEAMRELLRKLLFKAAEKKKIFLDDSLVKDEIIMNFLKKHKLLYKTNG